jgi:uncharacterized protein YgbK (DUF1537 family)
MVTLTGTDMLALADDLSGAAEIAVLLGAARADTQVVLGGHDPVELRARICVVDLDSRHLPPEGVADRIHSVVSQARSARIFLKLDSLLRGPVAAAVDAVRPVVVASALPVLQRVVIDGVPTAAGLPLSAVGAWAVEGRGAPSSLAEALDPLPVTVVPLSVVRSAHLVEALRSVIGGGRVPVCDGVTDADLDRVARATACLPGVALAGAGGLAAAIGRSWGNDTPLGGAVRSAGPLPVAGPLIVVGTAEAVAAVQVADLVAAGVPELVLPVASLLAGTGGLEWVDAIIAGLAVGALILRVPPVEAEVDGAVSRALVARLATLVATALRVVGRPVDLVLTGGETARRVLDALGVRTLTPTGSVHHGAVISTTDDGRTVVTRPGSFGGPDSLVSILAALRPTGGEPHPLPTTLAPASGRDLTKGTTS